MNQIEIEKYDFIDALRGWAILSVIMIHILTWIHPSNNFLSLVASQGMQGVRLFFITSAFTLFLSMSKRNQNESSPFLKYFIRRFFRIAPLFYVGIICYLSINGFSSSFYAPNGVNIKQVILTVFFVHAWFPDSINSIVPGGWSIGTEMTFYLVVPLLFLRIKSIKTTILLLILSIIIAKILNVFSLNYYNKFFNYSQDLLYYFQSWWFFAQFPVFLVGILLFQVVQRINKFNEDKKLGDVLLLFALFLCFTFLKTKSFFDIITPDYFYSFALFFFALALYIKPNFFFVNSFIKMIGKYSYNS